MMLSFIISSGNSRRLTAQIAALITLSCVFLCGADEASTPTPALTVVVTQAPTPEPTQIATPPPTPEPTQVVTPPPTSMPTPNPSNAPTPPPTTASLQLEVTFSGSGSPPNPLPKCHGDCDNDSQCEGSLVCFQRYVSFEQSTFLHPLLRLLVTFALTISDLPPSNPQDWH